MNMKNSVIALGLMTTLSACLGGGNDGGGIVSGDGSVNLDSARALSERAEMSTDIVDLEELPSTATMNGFLLVDLESIENGVIMGNMEVTADFEEGGVTGTATNITEYKLLGNCESAEDCDGEFIQQMPGQLLLAGVIDGAAFDGDLVGEVTGMAEQEEGPDLPFDADISLEVDGMFTQEGDDLMALADLGGEATLAIDTGEGIVEETELLSGFFITVE